VECVRAAFTDLLCWLARDAVVARVTRESNHNRWMEFHSRASCLETFGSRGEDTAAPGWVFPEEWVSGAHRPFKMPGIKSASTASACGFAGTAWNLAERSRRNPLPLGANLREKRNRAACAP